MIIPGMGGGLLGGGLTNILLDIEVISSITQPQSMSIPASTTHLDVYGIGMGQDGFGGNISQGGDGGRAGDFFAVENIPLVGGGSTLWAISYTGSKPTHFVLADTNTGFNTQYFAVAGGNGGVARSYYLVSGLANVLDEFWGGIGGTGSPFQHGGGGGGAANGGGGTAVAGHGSNGVNSTSGFSGAGGSGGTGAFAAGTGGQGATNTLLGFGGNSYGGGGGGSGRINTNTSAGAPGWMRIRFKSSDDQARLFEPSGIVLPPSKP